MCKLCLAEDVYHIWRERNGRIFRNHGGDSASLVSRVVGDVLVSVLGEGSLHLLRIKNWALPGVFLVGCSSTLSLAFSSVVFG